jgi:hypothetical protein
VIPEGLFGQLHTHLFQGDHDEHGAVIGAGVSRTADGRVRLLARWLDCARDGIDFVSGRRGYKMFRAEYVRDQILRCRDDKLIYLNIHNHGGTDRVEFSGEDLRSHERGYPALLDIARNLPVGALVFALDAIAGDIWLPGGRRVALTRAVVVGRRRRVLTPSPVREHARAIAMYDRQTRLFGDAGQTIFRNATIALVGAGGVGALLVEWLARLGVGHLIVIDPERIEPSNLPRFPGATRWDALVWFTGPGWPRWVRRLAERLSAKKVRIANRVIRRANPTARIEAIAKDVLEPSAAARLLDCDYIFLAADSMRARLLFNAIVHQYLIPGVQIGSKVSADKATGDIASIHSIARPVTSESGCLLCNQLINQAKLQEEGQTAAERRAQKYVDDPDVAAPSVITLNVTAASQAVNDFMLYMTGLTRSNARVGYTRFMPLTREVFLDIPRQSRECSECSAKGRSRLGRGDLGPRLPTYYSPS